MRYLPGLNTLRGYQRAWLRDDLVAGLALSAVLVPVGMGYAQASGLEPVLGLYATLVPLLVYALVGPSRILVLGPDSTLAALVAAVVLTLGQGDAVRSAELAATLALLCGAMSLLLGLARLGLLAQLLSKPIRLGFLNAVALTVVVGQAPRLLGLDSRAHALPGRLWELWQAALQAQGHASTMVVSAASFALLALGRRWYARAPWPLLLLFMATLLSWAWDLPERTGMALVGMLPQGLPRPALPSVAWADVVALLPAAAMLTLLVFTDTSVLSRTLAQRNGQKVHPDQETLALGLCNLACGLWQGFPVSASASRTPVAQEAGARTQLCSVVGALAIAALLLWGTHWLHDLPSAVLAVVVVRACWSFADFSAMAQLWRLRRVEFVLSLVSFLGVALVGVIEGVAFSIALALLVLVWNAWHPYSAILVRVPGTQGFHDASRHPEGQRLPGLVLFRWDEQLFFANAEVFQRRVLHALAQAPSPTRRLVVVADAISDVDITAADMLQRLHAQLRAEGVDLCFAGMKGVVRDRLEHYGTLAVLGREHFSPTVGYAIHQYRKSPWGQVQEWQRPPPPT